jgi:hypothetical protein
MNERIKQFAEQAGYKADMFGFGHWDMPECKKFAELIVKECLCQVDKMDAVLEDDKEKIGVAWAGLAIAKHFGVD